MNNLVNGWEVVVGLEVHAQISSNTKLFSKSPANFGAEPNTNVSFYDAAMPGMLPVLNQFCVDQAIKSGFGINGTINKVSRFDRKNYFYPDLPAGYQISQMYSPIVCGGEILITLPDGSPKTIKIERIHIEQDAGKSLHNISNDFSYIDLNRSGIALMEIVSRPDLRSSIEAMLYIKKLRMILKYVKTCDCNMEKGNFRVDANVSIRKPGEEFGTRTEIKNINSVRFVGQAIDCEVERQISLIENGEKIVQETMLFDPQEGRTRPMRSKENAADYRYFPDPDLKHIVLSDERIEKIKQTVPELPDAKKKRIMEEYSLQEYDADVLVETAETADSFEQAAKASRFRTKESNKQIANWIIGDLFAFLKEEAKTIDKLHFPIVYISELVDLVLDQTISGSIAKTVFAKMIETSKNPKKIVEDLGLVQIQDSDVIKKIVHDVLTSHPKQVVEYKNGKVQLFGFFVGETMKSLKGKGNPGIINEMLKIELENKSS